MAFKRKYPSTKRFSKRRRVYRRIARPLARARPRQLVHNFVRTCALDTDIPVSNSGAYAIGQVFKLTDLDDYTDFTNLYDAYRICGILFWIEPVFTGADLNPITTQLYLPNVHTCIDRTDSGSVADENEIMQYATHKMTRGHQTHKRFFKPSVLASNFETITTTAYTPKFKAWLTTDDPATPYYGIKLYIGALNNATSIHYRMFAKYYLQCKSVK